MPNNKGYIINGHHFYGYKPAEKNQNIVLFENKYIYEVYSDKILKFIKNSNGRRELLETSYRKRF